jgi:4-amino-4-deoxy-L-arabinose transferase-like glycosyltransferase
MVLLAVGSRWHWPITPKHQALILWGGWLVTCAIFFSIAGFFHEYYLSMIGPPLAALVAIGLSQIWDLAGTRPWFAISALGVSGTGTVAFQIYTATNFIQNVWWLSLVVILLIIGLTALAIMAINQKPHSTFAIGFMLLGVAILFTPGIWSVYTNLSASQNQSLPSAYSGGAIGPVAQRGLQINQNLLDYLQSNTEEMKYLMAVPSSMQGADYVIATGRPVLYMGGFSGQDDVVSAEDLTRLVEEGELRYIYWNAGGRGMGEDSDISSWIASSCVPLQGFDTSTRNAGAPDGIGTDQINGSNDGGFPTNGPMGAMQVTLYDCAD